MPGSSTSARITCGPNSGKFRERVFAAADAQHFVIPFAQQRFVTFAGVFLILHDEDALDGMIVGGHQDLNLPAVLGNSKERRRTGSQEPFFPKEPVSAATYCDIALRIQKLRKKPRKKNA